VLAVTLLVLAGILWLLMLLAALTGLVLLVAPFVRFLLASLLLSARLLRAALLPAALTRLVLLLAPFVRFLLASLPGLLLLCITICILLLELIVWHEILFSGPGSLTLGKFRPPHEDGPSGCGCL
jgi:hypothetical protein